MVPLCEPCGSSSDMEHPGLDPSNDQRVKGVLSKALAKDGVISLSELAGFMKPEMFHKLAGPDAKLDSAEVTQSLLAATPESRSRLVPALREHADYLTTTFDMIDQPHRDAGLKLARWIAATYKPGKPLHVMAICTGNSRRSMLCSSMGNLAAAYYGMPEIRFHSGGTAPTAFNPRAIATLKAIGFDIAPTGSEAKRSEPKTANPVYRVAWGEGFETDEFSKHYGDTSNPKEEFGALMVCGEADAACPFVKGAAIRISMPYLDPKIYDDSAYESAKYAERRDDIGRLLLSVIMQARGEINSRTSHGP